jgi:heat shock protein HslJ
MTGLRQNRSALYRLVPVLSLVAIIALMAPLAATAAALQSEAAPPATVQPPATGPLKLTNHVWRLVSLNGHDVDPAVSKPPQMNLTEQDSRIVGYAGCNRFMGTYVLHQQELRIEDGLAVTRMACHAGMDLEADFLKVLQSVDSWKIADGILELSHQKEVVARFKAV